MGRQTNVAHVRIGVKNDHNNGFNKTYERSTWYAEYGLKYAANVHRDYLIRNKVKRIIDSDEDLKPMHEKTNISRASGGKRESITIYVSKYQNFYLKLMGKQDAVVEEAPTNDVRGKFSPTLSDAARAESAANQKKSGGKSVSVQSVNSKSLFCKLSKKLEKVGLKVGTNCEFIVLQSDSPAINAGLIVKQLIQAFENREQYSKVLRHQERFLQYAFNYGLINGAKIEVAGRLNGAAIARAEKMRIGSVCKDTFDRAIDFAQGCAYTQYGCIGIKVWVDVKSRGGSNG